MPMKLSEYDPDWADAFADEAWRIAETFGELALRIEHVGSTAVPGLHAKPVIDIQVSLASLKPLEPLIDEMASLGYSHLPLPDPPVDVYPFFHRPERWPTTHHVHLCELGGDEEQRHLAFRDWLRAHPEDRDTYGAVKLRLAQEVDETDVASLFRYSESKGDVVREIERKALSGAD